MRKANTFSQPIFRYSEEVHGMKKLLMLTTGGTIASVEGENGLAPGVKADELLSYVSKLDNDIGAVYIHKRLSFHRVIVIKF